jgi:DNL zinc finger
LRHAFLYCAAPRAPLRPWGGSCRLKTGRGRVPVRGRSLPLVNPAVPAGARTTRFVNPHAYGQGTVFVQCDGCAVWHQLVDNMGLIEEYRFPSNAKAERGRIGDTDHTSALNSDDEQRERGAILRAQREQI